MMCDIVFAADSPLRPARVKIGTLPGAGGTQRLPRRWARPRPWTWCCAAA
jgi:enoyl-CoA hydratase